MIKYLYTEEDNNAENEWAANARTAKNDMEEASGRESEKIGLKIEEAVYPTRWREGVKAIAEGMRCIQPSFSNYEIV